MATETKTATKSFKALSRAERDERRNEIIRRLKTGETIEALATEYGLSYTTVYGLARAAGISTKQHENTKRVIMVINGLLNTPDSVDTLAHRFKVQPRLVREIFRIAKQTGIEFPTRGATI